MGCVKVEMNIALSEVQHSDLNDRFWKSEAVLRNDRILLSNISKVRLSFEICKVGTLEIM